MEGRGPSAGEAMKRIRRPGALLRPAMEEAPTMRRVLCAAALLAVMIAGPALALDLDDVIGMLEAGVSEDVILRLVDSEEVLLRIEPEDVLDLKNVGASDWFVEELLDRSEPRERVTRYYRAIEPSYSFVTIGYVFDPFDYYFVHWPYYYAYVSPFRFCWNWWYYGGPVHPHWCDGWGWRTDYYWRNWGTRVVWDRGWHARTRHHVPRYSDPVKEHRGVQARTARYDRPSEKPERRTWTRREDGTRPARPSVQDRGSRGDRPPSGHTWRRPERPEGSKPPRTPRPEIGRTPPPGGAAPRPGSGRGAPARGAPQAGTEQRNEQRSEPSRPSPPSTGWRR